MGHKVHPKAMRIRELNDWDSRWFDSKKIPQYIAEDFYIREFLNKKLDKASVEKIEIERFSGKLKIIISTARPGLIIGRGGGGIEDLRKMLEKKVLKSKEKKDLKLEIREIKNPWLSASLTAQGIAQQLEKRMPHRRVLKQTLSKVMAHKEIKGARVEVAGRLDGADIARTTWLQAGRLPRQTLRADVDYAQTRAECTYGTIGVKVWLYKGEKFDHKVEKTENQ